MTLGSTEVCEGYLESLVCALRVMTARPRGEPLLPGHHEYGKRIILLGHSPAVEKSMLAAASTRRLISRSS
jgi:hypothetical protein